MPTPNRSAEHRPRPDRRSVPTRADMSKNDFEISRAAPSVAVSGRWPENGSVARGPRRVASACRAGPGFNPNSEVASPKWRRRPVAVG